MPTRRQLLISAAGLGGLGTAATVQAAGYPDRPVRIVVPVPPGGPTDQLARKLAEHMATTLGQSVIVENRSGSAGLIGAAAVAKAPADGYTLLVGFTGIMSISPSLYRSMPLDPARELAPVSMLVSSPLLLVVRADSRVKQLDDILRLGHEAQGLSFGSSGNGSSMHLTGELLSSAAHLKLLHVPYRGSTDALQGLLGGQLDMAISDVPFYLPHLQGGKVRAIAVTGGRRHPLLPEIPTFAERGLPQLRDILSWQGLFAPAGTPAAVLERVQAAVASAMRSADMRELMVGQGYTVDTTAGAAFRSYLAQDAARWAAIVQKAGIRLDQ